MAQGRAEKGGFRLVSCGDESEQRSKSKEGEAELADEFQGALAERRRTVWIHGRLWIALLYVSFILSIFPFLYCGW